MRVRADNRLDRRRGFASKSAGIDQPLARHSGSTPPSSGGRTSGPRCRIGEPNRLRHRSRPDRRHGLLPQGTGPRSRPRRPTEPRPRIGEVFELFMRSRREWRTVIVTEVLVSPRRSAGMLARAQAVVGTRRPTDVPQRRPRGAVGAGRDAPSRRVNPAADVRGLYRQSRRTVGRRLCARSSGGGRCGRMCEQVPGGTP